MRRIRLIVAYEGTQYVGWQVQNNGLSVQQVLEEALLAITGEHASVQGSGRTDSGVHARAQTAHFDTNARMGADKFAIALNSRLPGDIRVLYSEEAPPEFHARFSAKDKEYRYSLLLAHHQNPFTRRTSLHIHYGLDLTAMKRAAGIVEGTHDFNAFRTMGVPQQTTVRTIFSSRLEQNGCYVTYIVSGNGFMYNMVRILMGTLLDIGAHRLPEDAMEQALKSGCRGDLGPTAPAHGLTLWRVTYPDFDTEAHLPYGF